MNPSQGRRCRQPCGSLLQTCGGAATRRGYRSPRQTRSNLTGVVGQDDAIEALRFGLEISGPGQNIFVRGLPGTGRLSLVRQLLDAIRPTCPLVDDRCYVHNFAQPDRPRLLTVPRSQGTMLSRRIDELIAFIQHDLGPLLASDALRAQRAALDDRLQEAIRRVGEPLEEELRANQLALVPIQAGPTVQPALLPVIDGTPVSPERFARCARKGPSTRPRRNGSPRRLRCLVRASPRSASALRRSTDAPHGCPSSSTSRRPGGCSRAR